MTSEVSHKVILVDQSDQVIGQMEKLEAHQKGVLHRAFSILLFNSAGEMLLQQRAYDKYHSGGLWTNTCCSHPAPSETVIEAANRRLKEEMGIEAALDFAFKFIYKAKLDHGLTEYEYDHVFIGRYGGEPEINPIEVNNWKWISLNTLNKDIKRNPDNYTVWFKDIMKNKELATSINSLLD